MGKLTPCPNPAIYRVVQDKTFCFSYKSQLRDALNIAFGVGEGIGGERSRVDVRFGDRMERN